MIIDTLNIIIFYFLIKINKKQRLLSNQFGISLSEKYQLVENIRVITMFNGQSIITLIFGFFGNLIKLVKFVLNESEMQSAILRIVSLFTIF